MAQEQTPKQICSKMHTIAKNIMTDRQNQKAMPDVMETRGVNKLTENLILGAYRKPLFSSESYKQKEIGKYANEAYVNCMTILLGGK